MSKVFSVGAILLVALALILPNGGSANKKTNESATQSWTNQGPRLDLEQAHRQALKDAHWKVVQKQHKAWLILNYVETNLINERRAQYIALASTPHHINTSTYYPQAGGSWRCPQYSGLFQSIFGAYAHTFDHIANHESGCQPWADAAQTGVGSCGDAQHSYAKGLVQICIPLHNNLFTGKCAGGWFDPVCNLEAAHQLFLGDGLQPWNGAY